MQSHSMVDITLQRQWFGLRRGWTDEGGQAIVETALIFPVLLLVVLGIMQLGLLCMNWTLTTYAAFETARQASFLSQFVDNDTGEPISYQEWMSRGVAGIATPGKDVLASIASSILIGGITEDQVNSQIEVLGSDEPWDGEVQIGEFPHLSVSIEYPAPITIPFISQHMSQNGQIIIHGKGTALIYPFEGGN